MVHNQTNQPIRKVTLSCRVLPEQKLLIAERAKSVDMSLSQYVEAKILQNDNLELEKTIQRLQIELEQRNAEIQNLSKSKSTTEEELTRIRKEFDSFHQEVQSKPKPKFNQSSLTLQFEDENEKKHFRKKLSSIAEKYDIGSLQATLKLCLDYTIENDRSFFIIKTVKDFFRKKTKTKLSHSNQIH